MDTAGRVHDRLRRPSRARSPEEAAREGRWRWRGSMPTVGNFPVTYEGQPTEKPPRS